MRKKLLAVLLTTAVTLTSLPAGSILYAAKGNENDAAGIAARAEVLPYQDTSLSFEERAVDLVSRMTLSEKAAQTVNNVPAIPRLGVSSYDYWSEALHGVARSGEATSYPTGLGIAATWDKEMVLEMAEQISDEARGYNNGKGKGLSYWSPTINLSRDPRWGRAEETYGEDTYLTAAIGGSFVDGLQGDDERYVKAIATIKHFVANNSEFNRHNGSSDVDDRDLFEYYSYAFQEIVEKNKVESVMSSYNQLNGIPMSANSFMLTDVLRNRWGFDGYVTSDCGAIYDIYGNHRWVPEGYTRPVNAAEAAALSILAGCDVNCGGVYNANVSYAISQGLMTEEDLDRALIRLFTARMRTGEFDPAEDVPYKSSEYSYANQVEAADHKQLAEDMADDAVVLLKNEAAAGGQEPVLPVDASAVDHVVIVGALADEIYLGDYSGAPSAANRSNAVQGITAAVKRGNPDAVVTHIDSDGTKYDPMSYLMNIRDFTFTYNQAGKNGAYTVAQADESYGCRYENNRTNIGYISSGAYLRYDNVDLNGLDKISVSAAGAQTASFASHVEVHAGAPDGPVIAEMKPAYTSGWQDYASAEDNTDLSGIQELENQTLYITFKYSDTDIEFTAAQEQTIAEADLVIAYVGTRTAEEAIGSEFSDCAEEMDRDTLDLPRNQQATVKKCAQLNENTIAYIQAVGQVNIEPFIDEVPAVFWSAYNGQAQGNAAGRLIFGESNPTARLPFTWYKNLYQLDDIGEYNIRSSEERYGRTYQYFTGDVTYPFGYGLSYTDYTYSNLTIDKNSMTPNDEMEVSVDVKNNGTVTGKEAVQMYVVSPDAAANDRPYSRLKGFEKVEIGPGETKTVKIRLDAADLHFWDEENDQKTYDPGQYEIRIGKNAEDAGALKTTFVLNGERKVECKAVTLTPDVDIMRVNKGVVSMETTLTAAMNDDTLYDLSQAEVVYSSSNPEAAGVDAEGTVTAVGEGIATITAKVTIGTIEKEAKTSIAVVDADSDIQIKNAYAEIGADQVNEATNGAVVETNQHGYGKPNLGWIRSDIGCTAIFKKIDFADQIPAKIHVEAACAAAAGGIMEVYADEVKAENRLASVTVTPGPDHFWSLVRNFESQITFTGAMQEQIQGIHDIYLVIKGTGSDNYAFNLLSFRFEAAEPEPDTAVNVKYSAQTGGRIEGNTNQKVKLGENAQTVTAIAEEGYEFTGWSDGRTEAVRTDQNVKAEIDVTAYFAEKREIAAVTAAVRYLAGPGGTIRGKAQQTVEIGKNAETVTAMANSGYEFTGWSDGVKTASRTDKNIQKAMTVTAGFQKKTAALKVGDQITVGGHRYKITSTGKAKTVDYAGTKKNARKVTIQKQVQINGETYQVTGIAAKAMKNYKKLTAVKIGANVKVIKKNAFAGCARLTKITIPKAVTRIDTKAFYKCKKLKKITVKTSKLNKVGKNALKGISKKAVIKVPKKKSGTYKKLFKKGGLTKSVAIK